MKNLTYKEKIKYLLYILEKPFGFKISIENIFAWLHWDSKNTFNDFNDNIIICLFFTYKCVVPDLLYFLIRFKKY
jgi:hypothetical protein